MNDLSTPQRDAGPRIRSDKERAHASRLEVIGRIACNMAHDLNNILGVVRGSADLLQTRRMSNRERRRILSEIRRAADRGADLTHQVLSFGRRDDGQQRAVDPNVTLDEVKNILGRIVGDQVRLNVNPGRDVPCVSLGEGELELVLFTLADNARDAMPSGGELSIATSRIEIAAPGRPSVPAHVPVGPYVLIAVRDTGCGMDARTVKHAFMPFFTTKARGEGTGLGLSNAASIVKERGGYIWIDSSVAVGTTVSILLPTHSPRRSETGATRPANAG